MKNSKINFDPWVGNNYFSRGYCGKKILVLGESHYCKDLSNGKCSACKRDNMRDDCFSQTVDVISDYIENYTGERYEQTFLCFERAVLGKKLSLDERKEFWHSVVFYNYIQFDQSGPRKNLIPETSNTSEEASKEILEKYKPDCIIVWGCRLYSLLPHWGGKDSVLKVGNDSTDVFIYNIGGKNIPAMKVYHPSCPKGKSWSYWHKFHEKFLNS